MKYFIKIVYKDKLEPTTYFDQKAKFKEIKEKIEEILLKFSKERKIKGIFIGRS